MMFTLNQGGGNFSVILQNLELLISNRCRNEFLPAEQLHLIYSESSESDVFQQRWLKMLNVVLSQIP